MTIDPVAAPKQRSVLTRVSRLWMALALAYAILLAWHQPLRGPLSEAEVREAFGEGFDIMHSGANPDAANLIDFFLNDDGRAFHMINLNALARTEDAGEATRTYGRFMGPRLLVRASYPVLKTGVITGLTNSLGPGADAFDEVVIVRYRSRRDLLAIIATPEFRGAMKHKSASLDGWVSAPASGQAGLSIPLLTLSVLLAIGGFWTVLSCRHARVP